MKSQPRDDLKDAAAPDGLAARDRKVRRPARTDTRTGGRTAERFAGLSGLVIAAALLSIVLTAVAITVLDLSLLWAVPIYGIVGALLVLGLAGIAAWRDPSDRGR